ncbi:TetR/AcrR family transcriptional regulator [Mycolicibacterium mucogenicum]|uniref:TetR/AcrR family transcriptional regulator n=1 Tax=Mycolicibacterium mucogenicum TaxID=56689 RepID=UPI001F2AB411|nr:TetR/AcrR family transcriptional regulator [Mycolicibacterium mucogenicum]
MTLFSEHGVHGTSLKMIADHVGVGKAAVYYQFHSKDEIALEVVRPALDDMARVVRIAKALPDWDARRAVTVSGLVEMAVRHRRLAALLHSDPAIEHLITNVPDLKSVADQLRELLEGPERQARSRIASLVFLAGIGSAAANADLVDVDDADLHAALFDLGNKILQPVAEDV